jgi:hypothetical protein
LSSNSGKTSICEIEETKGDGVTTRFYDIAISATDAAGNIGTKTCSVIVIPDDHYNVRTVGKSEKSSVGKSGKSSSFSHDPNDLRAEYKLSTERYVISELSLEWDPNLDTTLSTPPLPTPNINSKSSKSAQTKSLHFPAHLAGKGKDPESILCGKEKGGKEQGSKGQKSKGQHNLVKGEEKRSKGQKDLVGA